MKTNMQRTLVFTLTLQILLLGFGLKAYGIDPLNHIQPIKEDPNKHQEQNAILRKGPSEVTPQVCIKAREDYTTASLKLSYKQLDCDAMQVKADKKATKLAIGQRLTAMGTAIWNLGYPSVKDQEAFARIIDYHEAIKKVIDTYEQNANAESEDVSAEYEQKKKDCSTGYTLSSLQSDVQEAKENVFVKCGSWPEDPSPADSGSFDSKDKDNSNSYKQP